MAECRVCMASVTWALTPDGDKIPIDDRETRREGEDRWRISSWDGPMPKLEPVAATWPGEAQVDHRQVCQQPRVI
jgi:hypothetical protein